MNTNRATLLPDELVSLRALAAGTKRTQVPMGHGATLIRCGFAAGHTGRLAITMAGRAKLIIELTRASWASVLL